MAATPASGEVKPAAGGARGSVQAATNYIDWHTLLARVYDIDLLS